MKHPTKKEFEDLCGLIAEAKRRLLIILEAHTGWFPSSSELASATGLTRSYNRIALDQLAEEGVIRYENYGGMKAVVLAEQTPSPLMKHATYLSHRGSMTENDRGSDCHPWVSSCLVCVTCATVRTLYPEWRVSPDDAITEPNGSPKRPRHGQLSLVRKKGRRAVGM